MPNLTDAEFKVLALAWQCFKGGAPDIDYVKLAPLCGHTNPKSTANVVGAIKKKLVAMNDPQNDATADATSKPDSPAKKSPAKPKPASRKRKASSKNGESDSNEDKNGIVKKEGSVDAEEDTKPAPKKKKRAVAAKKDATQIVAKAESDKDAGAEEEVA